MTGDKKIPICADCRYHQEYTFRGNHMKSTRHNCKHPKITYISTSPVTGKESHKIVNCEVARGALPLIKNNNSPCGPEGLLWEAQIKREPRGFLSLFFP